jgi:hypothetical protein
MVDQLTQAGFAAAVNQAMNAQIGLPMLGSIADGTPGSVAQMGAALIAQNRAAIDDVTITDKVTRPSGEDPPSFFPGGLAGLRAFADTDKLMFRTQQGKNRDGSIFRHVNISTRGIQKDIVNGRGVYEKGTFLFTLNHGDRMKTNDKEAAEWLRRASSSLTDFYTRAGIDLASDLPMQLLTLPMLNAYLEDVQARVLAHNATARLQRNAAAVGNVDSREDLPTAAQLWRECGITLVGCLDNVTSNGDDLHSGDLRVAGTEHARNIWVFHQAFAGDALYFALVPVKSKWTVKLANARNLAKNTADRIVSAGPVVLSYPLYNRYLNVPGEATRYYGESSTATYTDDYLRLDADRRRMEWSAFDDDDDDDDGSGGGGGGSSSNSVAQRTANIQAVYGDEFYMYQVIPYHSGGIYRPDKTMEKVAQERKQPPAAAAPAASATADELDLHLAEIGHNVPTTVPINGLGVDEIAHLSGQAAYDNAANIDWRKFDCVILKIAHLIFPCQGDPTIPAGVSPYFYDQNNYEKHSLDVLTRALLARDASIQNLCKSENFRFQMCHWSTPLMFEPVKARSPAVALAQVP